jgi:hypothetical protein
MTILEEEVRDNFDAIREGIAWVVVARVKRWTGRRALSLEIIWPEDEDDRVRAKAMIAEDPDAILVNAYQNAWVGFAEDGDYYKGEDLSDVVKRLRWGYREGRCRATANNVDALEEYA